MKCAFHNERDAIGACVSCGRGLCEECKIEVSRKFTCKLCVEKESARFQYPYPPYPLPMHYGYPPSPYDYPAPYPFWMPIQKPVLPKGTPKKFLFLIGGMGSILLALVAGMSGFTFLWYVFPAPYPFVQTLVPISSVLMFIAMCITSVGFFGYYWNYGRISGLVAMIVMLCCGTAYMTLFVSFMGQYYFDVWLIAGLEMFGISPAVMAWANSMSRDMSTNVLPNVLVVFLVVTAMLFFLLIPMILGFGWFLFAFAMFMQSAVFQRARMPEEVSVSQAATQK